MQEVDYVSPYGPVKLFGDGGRLCRVVLVKPGKRAVPGRSPRRGSLLGSFVEMLEDYFRGVDLRCKPGLLSLEDVSNFRRQVYGELMKVGFGQLVSYGELARRCGRPGAARAVGRAMATNALPIFIPCHRVVSADGSLGGFGAGAAWKRSLLRHEGWLLSGGRIVRNEGTGAFSPFGG